MADVFLSYSREDAARAEQVAKGLQAAGLQVFWDTEIPPGTTWADYIESKLNQCKALIVLWSEHSTKSQWVREEARMGRDKGVLIPVMIDNSQPPFGFGEVQAANLATWNGEADHPNWRRFVDAVMSVTQTAPRPSQAMPSAPPRAAAPGPAYSAPAAAEKKSGVPVWVWVGGAVVATIVVLGIIGSMMPQQQQQQAFNPPAGQQQAMNQPQQQPTGDQNWQQTLSN
ncbi:MAG: toll/interleukin-1 receptor domain-containing protein, partial [Hyphomonadaceae bacterium]